MLTAALGEEEFAMSVTDRQPSTPAATEFQTLHLNEIAGKISSGQRTTAPARGCSWRKARARVSREFPRSGGRTFPAITGAGKSHAQKSRTLNENMVITHSCCNSCVFLLDLLSDMKISNVASGVRSCY